jgi:hypothetical protein
MKQIIISSGYQWSNSQDLENLSIGSVSEIAVKSLVESVLKDKGIAVIRPFLVYKRLGASAGRLVFDGVYNKILSADILIFDISEGNPNVFIELGIALALQRENGKTRIFLIGRKSKDISRIEKLLPSDLQGAFVSEYVLQKEKITFKDRNSLRSSIIKEIKEVYNSRLDSGFID